MSVDRPYIEANDRERARMRAIIERADEQTLRLQVNPHWTVAGVLGHIAFWDARILALAEKLERGVPFAESDTEEEDVDWINDASRPLIHAIEPVEAARVSLEIAATTDAKVANLAPEHLNPMNPESPLYAFRSEHRGEHLDDVERALRDAES